MKKICVFCGSNKGVNPVYAATAKELGQYLARNNYHLVYGAGNVGLMGVLADATLEAGGKVTGIIPDFLMAKEVGHKGLTELIITKSMHERKQKMADLSDGFIALPGGCGTMEELFETFTWAQLGLHKKPLGLLNVSGYYDYLLAFLDNMSRERFLSRDNRDMILTDTNYTELIRKMNDYQAPDVEKWLDRAQT